MFIVNNTFFLPFLYFLYLSLHEKHQKKFLVCENLLGNKSDSDSDNLLKKIQKEVMDNVEKVHKNSWITCRKKSPPKKSV